MQSLEVHSRIWLALNMKLFTGRPCIVFPKFFPSELRLGAARLNDLVLPRRMSGCLKCTRVKMLLPIQRAKVEFDDCTGAQSIRPLKEVGMKVH